MSAISLDRSYRETRYKSVTKVDFTLPLELITFNAKIYPAKFHCEIDDEPVHKYLIAVSFTSRLIQIDEFGNPALWQQLTDTWHVRNIQGSNGCLFFEL